MADVPKYYWDACIWIELITQANAERLERCRHVVDLVKGGDAELWTSAFTLAEVWKKRCDVTEVGIPEEQDQTFEDFIESEFVKIIEVNVDVGILARRLLRRNPSLGKPQDAVHVASALLENLDELHTFDGRDLIRFNDVFPRRDKIKLKICEPPQPPTPEMLPDDDEN